MEDQYKCAYTELLSVKKIKPHKRNPNKHPQDQIERLAKIIDYQGQRHPVIISKLSGMVVAGNGRTQAMKLLGWDKIAVDYQEFENEDQEYAFLVSDNAISEWAELDLKLINAELELLGPIDIELLGLKSFEVEPADKEEKKTKDKETKDIECPSCGEVFSV